MTPVYIQKAASGRAKRLIAAALRTMEPRVAAAFRAAVRAIRDSASLAAIARAIQDGDIELAVRLTGTHDLAQRLSGMGVAPGATNFVREARAAFEAGATGGQLQMPKGLQARATLDLTDPQAVRYLRETLPTLIREVGEESIRAARAAVQRGFEEGRPAPKIAREIRDSIGLTQKQSSYVGNFRRQLETGESPPRFQLPWNRRLSASERAQARSIYNAGGERSSRVNRLVARYYESLVNRRSKNIARTEVHRAFEQGREETWRQATERGLLDPATTRRVWIVTPDDRLRPDHAAIPVMNPNGVRLDQPFETPFGAIMAPSDPHPNLINCRCTVALEFDE